MADRATIHDVARDAGVAVKTVSRVLNGEDAVSAAMRDRVRASIRALDYRPNSAARMLRTKVTRSIGFVCADIAEPVQARLARAIETVAMQHDSTLTISLTHHDPAREQRALESLLSRQVDGLVVWPTGVGSRYLRRLVRTVAVVCVDRPIDGVQTDAVFCDNRDGAEQAVNRLLERGHQRIAFVGDRPELFTQRERLQGYRDALAARDLAAEPMFEFQREQQVPPLRRQLSYWRASPHPPTAIFAASSLSAAAVLRSRPESDRFDLISFDDFPLADVVRGGITVVTQDTDAIGVAAAETLFRRMATDQPSRTRTRISPTLIDRDCAAADPRQATV